jgi:hypothetical protein
MLLSTVQIGVNIIAWLISIARIQAVLGSSSLEFPASYTDSNSTADWKLELVTGIRGSQVIKSRVFTIILK